MWCTLVLRGHNRLKIHFFRVYIYFFEKNFFSNFWHTSAILWCITCIRLVIFKRILVFFSPKYGILEPFLEIIWSTSACEYQNTSKFYFSEDYKYFFSKIKFFKFWAPPGQPMMHHLNSYAYFWPFFGTFLAKRWYFGANSGDFVVYFRQWASK